VHGWSALQGHVVAEQQIKLSAQHYLDQLPQQSASEPEYEQQAAPLTVNWHEENGRDSVTIQGMCTPNLLSFLGCISLSCSRQGLSHTASYGAFALLRCAVLCYVDIPCWAVLGCALCHADILCCAVQHCTILRLIATLACQK